MMVRQQAVPHLPLLSHAMEFICLPYHELVSNSLQHALPEGIFSNQNPLPAVFPSYCVSFEYRSRRTNRYPCWTHIPLLVAGILPPQCPF